MLGTLNVAFDDLHHKVGIGDIVLHLMADNRTLVMGVQYLLLHHALTHGSHLWTVLGVDDGSYHIAAKGGEYL